MRRSSERGFTLVETLVTVTIVGIAFAVFVGGMGTAVLTSDYHRKHANARAAIRNFAEAVKATPYDPNCATAQASYAAAYSPPSPTRVADSATANGAPNHTAPSIDPARANSRLVTFFSLGTGSTFTPPTGMAQLWYATSTALDPFARVSAVVADQALASSSASGTRTAASLTAGASVSQAVVLESATAAADSIVRRGSTSASGTALSTFPLTKPNGTTVGDTMLAHIALRGGDLRTVTAPAGWELVISRSNATTVRSLVYQRTAATAGAQTFTWTFDAASEVVGGIVSYGGVAQAFSVSVTGLQIWNGTIPATTGTFHNCPGGDNGLQRVTLRVVSLDDRAEESVAVVKRRP